MSCLFLACLLAIFPGASTNPRPALCYSPGAQGSAHPQGRPGKAGTPSGSNHRHCREDGWASAKTSGLKMALSCVWPRVFTGNKENETLTLNQASLLSCFGVWEK